MWWPKGLVLLLVVFGDFHRKCDAALGTVISTLDNLKEVDNALLHALDSLNDLYHLVEGIVITTTKAPLTTATAVSQTTTLISSPSTSSSLPLSSTPASSSPLPPISSSTVLPSSTQPSTSSLSSTESPSSAATSSDTTSILSSTLTSTVISSSSSSSLPTTMTSTLIPVSTSDSPSSDTTSILSSTLTSTVISSSSSLPTTMTSTSIPVPTSDLPLSQKSSSTQRLSGLSRTHEITMKGHHLLQVMKGIDIEKSKDLAIFEKRSKGHLMRILHRRLFPFLNEDENIDKSGVGLPLADGADEQAVRGYLRHGYGDDVVLPKAKSFDLEGHDGKSDSLAIKYVALKSSAIRATDTTATEETTTEASDTTHSQATSDTTTEEQTTKATDTTHSQATSDTTSTATTGTTITTNTLTTSAITTTFTTTATSSIPISSTDTTTGTGTSTTDTSTSPSTSVEPTSLASTTPTPPWRDRVISTLEGMLDDLEVIDGGEAGHEQAAYMEQLSSSLDALVDEGTKYPTLNVSYEDLENISYVIRKVNATEKDIKEQISDKEAEKQEMIVTIVMLSILFVVVLVALIIALIRPWAGGCRCPRDRNSRRNRRSSGLLDDGSAPFNNASFQDRSHMITLQERRDSNLPSA